QALFAAAPTVVVGWLVAAIFERILGRSNTLKLFGGHTWKQIPYAWLLGMLLPVCSLGVIPIMHQMRKSGISGGTILAFGLTAPLFNPISVLYGLTLSDPFTLFIFCLGSLSIVTVIGVAWDRLFPNSISVPEELPPTPYGLQRIGAVALSMCQQAVGPSTRYMIWALVGVGILSLVLPAGVLQHSAGDKDLLAPLTMTAVASLAYITPMTAIVQVASMFQHGNSIGASFTLLVMGTGVNLGLVLWSLREFGGRKTWAWVALLTLFVLCISYGINGPLHPKGVQAADHTHAFDGYCNPFAWGLDNSFTAGIRLVREALSVDVLFAGLCGGVMMLVGVGFAKFDSHGRTMRYLTTMKEAKETSKDIVLPNSVVASVSLIGLVILSIVGCYVYYPETKEVRRELAALQADLNSAVAGKEWDNASFLIPQQKDWAHKLVVGRYIRGEQWNRFQAMRKKVFLSKLEMLMHECEEKEVEESLIWNNEARIAYRRFMDSLGSQTE
ncbi:MAG: permease, partial [Pirellula sp.]